MANMKYKDSRYRDVFLMMYLMGDALEEIGEAYGLSKQAIFDRLKDSPAYKLAVARRAKTKTDYKVKKLTKRIAAAVKKQVFTIESAGKIVNENVERYSKKHGLSYIQGFQAFSKTVKGEKMLRGYQNVVSCVRKENSQTIEKEANEEYLRLARILDQAVKAYAKKESISYNEALDAMMKTEMGKELAKKMQGASRNRMT